MRERERKITLLGSIIIFDQVLKVLALRSGIALINKGVGFGILLSGYLAIWLILSLIFLIGFFLEKKQTGFLLILAGGASNLLDRVFYGGVVDYLSLPAIPLFNLADASVVAGTILVFIDLRKNHRL